MKPTSDHGGYISEGQRYDSTPQRCECEQPWLISGGETCDRCGKRLPDRILNDPSRQRR